MQVVLSGMKERIPDLFEEDGTFKNASVSIPVKLNCKGDCVSPTVGQKDLETTIHTDGHILMACSRKLRWTSITVENKETKDSFIADLTLEHDGLSVDRFQLNTFLCGVHTLEAGDAAAHLSEFMNEDNDWHVGYTMGDADASLDEDAHIQPEEGNAKRRKTVVHHTMSVKPDIRKCPTMCREDGSPLKATRGEILNGIIWIVSKHTREWTNSDDPYPMFLFHNLKVNKPTRVSGNVTRTLLATSPMCHEGGPVDLTTAMEEMRDGSTEKSVFLACSEDAVLDFFHQMTNHPGLPGYGSPAKEPVSVIFPSFML